MILDSSKELTLVLAVADTSFSTPVADLSGIIARSREDFMFICLYSRQSGTEPVSTSSPDGF
jgi:hypothetical protein